CPWNILGTVCPATLPPAYFDPEVAHERGCASGWDWKPTASIDQSNEQAFAACFQQTDDLLSHSDTCKCRDTRHLVGYRRTERRRFSAAPRQRPRVRA